MKNTKFMLVSILIGLISGCNLGTGTSQNTQSSSGQLKIEEGLPLSSFGHDTFKNTEIASMAKSSIGFTNNRNGNCTGVVIEPHLILTAAHCVYSVDSQAPKVKPDESLNVYLPYDSITNKYIDKGLESTYKVVNVYHEFTKKEFGKDIAVIKVAESLPNPLSESAFSYLAFPDDRSTILKDLLSPIDAKVFTIGYGSNNKFEFRYAAASKFSPNKNGEMGELYNNEIKTQSGDSGGPVFVCKTKTNECSLIGITRGVNTRTADYITTTLLTDIFGNIMHNALQ